MTTTPAHPEIGRADGRAWVASAELKRALGTAAWILLLIALWALTHRYRGFARDGELYAVQALSRLHPTLAADLYLQNVSQDRFTVFSPLYAGLMWLIGLQPAEMVLFCLCSVSFLAAAWTLARTLFTRDIAWFSVALLIVTVGHYGAYYIFSYSENYLSARSMAEALVIAALACRYLGRTRSAWVIAAGAMLIHPLMALPGLVLLTLLALPMRAAVLAALASVLAALAVATLALLTGGRWPMLTLMDADWLEVVRERSQFLFLRYWGLADWEVALRPFVCLTLSALVTDQPRIRHLCFAAMLAGLAGLGIALVAGSVGPVALLVQGQAWRWMWLTGFVSVLLIVPTVARIWQDPRLGPLCATLLLLAWTFGAIDGLAGADAALALWLARPWVGESAGRIVRWSGILLIVGLGGWILVNCGSFTSTPIVETGRESVTVGRVREMFGVGGAPVFLVMGCWYWLRHTTGPLPALALAGAMFAAALWVLPGSLKQLEAVGTPAEIAEFADWRAAIPPTASVLIVPTTKSASFMWFSLGRPSYLTVDQSSGVVFSPLTAREVRRRGAVLAPLGPPDWRILSAITADERERAAGLAPKPPAKPKALTADSLIKICGDAALGFVIAREELGFEPLTHRHAGGRKDWNLYDCRKVRTAREAPDA